MSIVKKKKSQEATTNTTTKFSIRLNENESVEFRPTATFAHVSAKQVLKIITLADIDVTAENNRNKVNFKLTKDKLFGFLNYFENDLDDESEEDEIKVVLDDIKAQLSTVKLADISLPMTTGEADKLIKSL